ncbi:MAG: efflux RND transporter periplasmic adaptor subunit [Rhodobacteraceae bacterium]|nr:efflux RND transporter periplasmic adaptor subunit [Paracoccaceae bacterium]
MRAALICLALLWSGQGAAGTLTLQSRTVTDWKSVYGQVEARETVPARARIGGLVADLLVTEGDLVAQGQRIATVRDDKLSFQIAALDAQIDALDAQRITAEAELARGKELVGRGVATVQRLDQLQTDVDVVRGQIASVTAQRAVIRQQASEGEVLAPGAGRVLTVPVTPGAVILPGEPVATIGGGGFFLRLAIPERHAASLNEGDAIRISTGAAHQTGHIAKIYPEISNGRVTADVEVDGLETGFVNARVLVSLAVGTRTALLVPASAVSTRSGIDFVTVTAGGHSSERAVLLGEAVELDGESLIEVVTGLAAGDRIVTAE